MSQALVLEADAASAGLALACSYSSSDEYEASVIAERRAAGVYGPKRHQRQVWLIGAAAVALLLVIITL